MLTRPDHLHDDDVAAALRDRWDLPVDHIEYAPVGFGSHHWWVDADGERWFATVDDLGAKRTTQIEPLDEPFARLDAALRAARSLRAAGLDFVVAPVPDRDDHVLIRIGERFALALYPNVVGQAYGWGRYGSSEERRAVVEVLADLHGAPTTCAVTARAETFAMPNLDVLVTALEQLDTPWRTGPYGEPTRRLLAAHDDQVVAMIERYGALAAIQADRTGRFVLTHGEPHRANTITTDHGVVLVDWDTALVAPPERDLWRLVDEEPAAAQVYEHRTGIRVDPEAVELYRRAWELADIGVYTSQFRRHHTDTADIRAGFSNLRDALEPCE